MMDKKTNKFFMVKEFEEFARANLPRNAFDYYSSGADEEFSLKQNTEAFNHIKLLPKFLTNVSKIDTSVDIFGQKIDFPVMVAATAMQRFQNPKNFT